MKRVVISEKSGGVPRMCVGAVESGEKSGNIREISLIKP